MTRRLRGVVTFAAAALAVIAVPVLASASSSRQSDREMIALNELACPATNQCTAVDGAGREITFNPKSPRSHSRHAVDRYANNLACPATTFCVVVDGQNPGDAVAFVPKSGHVVKKFHLPNLNAGQVDGHDALACVSVDQCTTVTFNGTELTFDPRTGHTISHATLPHSAEGLGAIACTSPTACTALFADSTGTLQGYEVTFDPTTGAPNSAGFKVVGDRTLERLSCPAAAQCTGVDHYGGEVTFDPNTGQQAGAGAVTLWSRGAVQTVSCPSVSQCTAINAFGKDVTFDPGTGAHGRFHMLAPGGWIEINCPSLRQCTTVGGQGRAMTFNPAKGIGTIHTIDR